MELMHEHDHRLEEQVRLARVEMLQELEAQINVSKTLYHTNKSTYIFPLNF